MKRFAFLATIFASVLVIVLPFVGGSGPSPFDPTAYIGTAALADSIRTPSPTPTSSTVATNATSAISAISIAKTTFISSVVKAPVTTDSEHIAQKPVPPPPPPASSGGGSGTGTAARIAAAAAAGVSCPGNVGGSVGGAPSRVSGGGVAGTTSADLAAFALTYNSIRVANCLSPVPLSHFRYDACMETRLFWMAEDPSPDPASAWGHIGSHRSDGVPSVGCDGNLAGGSGNTGATVATKWWNSPPHRLSLYKPSFAGSTNSVCIYFAMTHGSGNLNQEPYSFTRAAARWSGC